MTADEDMLLTETNVEGSLFEPKTMEELKRKYEQGCWFLYDDWPVLLYRDLAFYKLIGRDHL